MRYTDYVNNIQGFLDNENVSDDEESEPVSQTPKFLSAPSTEDRDNVYGDENEDTLDESIDSVKAPKMTKLPSHDESASDKDLFEYLCEKYGKQNFTEGLNIVTKSHVLRFSEDGESKIKAQLEKILGDSSRVDSLYSD